MTTMYALLILAGLAVDIWFIATEYAGKMLRATVLKGLASLMFVLLGLLCCRNHPTEFGRLIVIGLVLGMIGDVLLNMRNLYEGGKSMKVFAVGILAFLSGHFLYIAALLKRGGSGILLTAFILTAVLSAAAIPPLMKRISAPSKGLKIFGYVYLVIVIAMFSCAAALLRAEGSALAGVFTAGGALFMISDFIMIYYSFGKKIKPLRAINLLSYYVGQLLIALCILLA